MTITYHHNPDTYLYKGEITNGCACQDFDETIADWIPADECAGYCWDDQVEDFTHTVGQFIDEAPSNRFRIEGFPLWHGTVAGEFRANDARGFLEAVTVRGDWTLRYEVTNTTFTAYLAHHDAAGTITVTPLPEEDE